MPKGVYTDFKCSEDGFTQRNEFIPSPHQELVLNYFPNSNHKGLLLFHKLGSG